MITNYAHLVKELRFLLLVFSSDVGTVFSVFPLGSRPVKA